VVIAESPFVESRARLISVDTRVNGENRAYVTFFASVPGNTYYRRVPPRAYYNEFDNKTASWLRELIREGHIAPGDVDERSIEDVTPGDLSGYTQCHFFAGIGGWSLALRLAGVPDSARVWTGSCPCQPFSAAGKGKGFADERHLWPAWHWLVQQCRPQLIFGEQVASAMQWFDLVSADLEAEGYAAGAAVLGAHSVGAPHIRQRLYWVADNNKAGFSKQRRSGLLNGKRSAQRDYVDGRGADGGMAHDDDERSHRSGSRSAGRIQSADGSVLGDANNKGPQGWRERGDGADERTLGAASLGRVANADGAGSLPGAYAGIHPSEEGGRTRDVELERPRRVSWADAEFIPCTDGKRRPVEPGTFPLAHGVSGRVASLRGYGNAIVPQVAAAFIEAYLDVPA
jgi:DNA (cytosine-5)-methyltransferase 1